MKTYLSSIRVEVGQEQRDLDSIANVAEQFKAIRLPYNKQLIGCNAFMQHKGEVYDLIASVLRGCLEKSGIPPAEFSHLYIVSADLTPLVADRTQMVRLLNQHGLLHAVPMLITGLECTGLITTLQIASQQVNNDGGKALVVSFDLESSDLRRIKPFGVVSDAATCTVVSAQSGEYEWLGAVNQSEIKGMSGEDDFESRQQLASQVTQKTLSHASVQMSDIKWIFSTNFYKPIADFNASTLGIERGLIYGQTMLDYGHCVCSDALLNLDHYTQQNAPLSGELYMLQAYAPGFMAVAIIRAC